MSADPPSPRIVGLSAAPTRADDVDSLAGTIGVLTDYRRVPGLDDGPAADYIAGRLEEYGYDIQQETFAVETDAGPGATRNVIGIKKGAG
ncbi:MAG: hypothetical protein PHR49_01775, partial [Methanoculleus sp.]|nr:hypothetical protein [Methanoculleus sp.]